MISLFRNLICYLFLYDSYFASAREGLNVSYATDGLASSYSAYFYQDFKLIVPVDRVQLGYIIRMSNYNSSEDLYYTDSTSSEKTNMNSIKIKSPNIYSLNAGFTGSVEVFSNFGLGLNLDLLGFSFGSTKNIIGYSAKAKVTPYNVFLYNINDIGSLNSEFYIYAIFDEKFLLRTGFSHYFSEYMTDSNTANNSTHFRRVSNLFFKKRN